MGLLALGALLLAVAVCEAIGWPFLREPLRERLAAALKRDVEIGENFKLRLLGSVRISSDRFALGPPAWLPPGSPPHFFSGEQVRLVLPYRTILGALRGGSDSPWRVRALEVGRFQATLWRDGEGRANWQFRDPSLPKPADDAGADVPQFDRLTVDTGTIRYDDGLKRVHVRAQARTEEGERSEEGARGLAVQGEGRYRDAEFDFRLSSRGVLPLIAPEGGSPPVPLSVRASADRVKLAFEGHAVDVLRLHGFEGSFSVSGPSLAAAGFPFGLTLPTTPPFEMEGRLNKDGQVWKADVARLHVGSSRLAGAFTFDRRPQRPVLTGSLEGERLVLRDLGPAFGARGPGKGEEGPAAARSNGRVLPAREFNLPALTRMDADVRVALRQLDLGTPYLRDLTPVRGHIRLEDGVLRIGDLLASTAGGQLSGAVGLDSNRKPPRWDIDLALAGIRLERWLNARNPRDQQGDGSHAPYVSGVLGGQAKLAGAGASTAAMLGSLQGRTALWVQDGQLSHLVIEALGIDIAESLGILLRGDQALPMRCAVAQFSAQDGVLKTDVGVIDTPDTTLLVDGTVALGDERLALVVRARPKDFTPLSLRSPIRIEGSFSDPAVRPEGKALGLKLLGAAALAAVNPLAALIPLIDPGERGQGGCRLALERLRVGGASPR
ncbi:MAG TPA: AsmA family protein [Burkholderiaceae bacterium]|nr:AsmA family protein [Burkholderiaceae bacterium]